MSEHVDVDTDLGREPRASDDYEESRGQWAGSLEGLDIFE